MKTDSKIYQLAVGPAIVTALILLVPLAANQFTSGKGWTLSDFVIMGTLLFGTGFSYKFVTRKSQEVVYRVATGFSILTGFLLIWVNLAVGIIGSSGNAINLLYFGVIAVGIIGAFTARFKSQKMTIVMFAMAFVQAAIAAIVLIGGFYQSPPGTAFHIVGVNSFFIMLFVVSALLFRYATQEQFSTSTEPED